MRSLQELEKLAGLSIYPASVQQSVGGVTYAIGRRDIEKFIVAVGEDCGVEGRQVDRSPQGCVCIGELSAANARAVRNALPWTAPRCLGLRASVGLGDRLGLATPGHIRALRGAGLAGVLAQQSIREMTRTRRTPQQVLDAATWGVLQEGFDEGFGADADHLQQPEDVDYTAQAGFKLFTLDPGALVDNLADTLDDLALRQAFERLDFSGLDVEIDRYAGLYAGRKFKLADGQKLHLDEEAFFRAAVKYGNAIAQVARMARRVAQAAGGDSELEISVDETDSPTTPAEHCFFAAELKRLGVKWVSLAPRFIGRFEKGVDYLGDPRQFRRDFARHVAVMQTLGPYKLSIHSGSDKFSIYPIIAELAGPYVHLKTSGTSYLEALRAVAQIEPGLFRDILEHARRRYPYDKASYHVSAQPEKVPLAEELRDEELPGVLALLDGRQMLHVTFGSVMTAAGADGAPPLGERILLALRTQEERHYQALQRHIARHLASFARTG
jgi:hypothetical protein